MKDHLSYSIKEVINFMGDKAHTQLKSFIKSRMDTTVGNFFDQLLIIGSYLDMQTGMPVSHAGTFLR